MTPEETLTELIDALDARDTADYNIKRINGYPRKTPGMSADLATWYDRGSKANDIINRIKKEHRLARPK